MVKLSLIFLLLWTLLPFGTQAQVSMLILCENDPPDQFLDKSGKLTGYAVEIVQEIQRRMGNKDPIRMVLWSSAYELIQKEANVVLFNMNRTKTREDLFHWIGPINEFSHGFFARKDFNTPIRSLESAKALPRIGVYMDDFRESFLLENGFKNLDRAQTSDANIRKLMAGHVPVVVTSPGGLDTQMSHLGFSIEDIKPLYIFMKTQSYIAISKTTDPTIVNDWHRHLENMKQDGTFPQIFSKWYPNSQVPGEALPPEV